MKRLLLGCVSAGTAAGLRLRAPTARRLLLGCVTLLVVACGSSAPVAQSHATAPSTPVAASPGVNATPRGTATAAPASLPPALTRGAPQPAGNAQQPVPTLVPFATPQTAGGSATVHTTTAGDFTETGSTCDGARDEVLFAFGSPGSGEEVDVVIHSGYHGPGTYSAPGADAYVSASHNGHTWYAQFSSSSGASITVDSGGRSGSFRFTDQVGTKEGVTGVFACG